MQTPPSNLWGWSCRLSPSTTGRKQVLWGILSCPPGASSEEKDSHAHIPCRLWGSRCRGDRSPLDRGPLAISDGSTSLG